MIAKIAAIASTGIILVFNFGNFGNYQILAIYFGLFAPYFDLPCLRLATPVASSVPRTT